MNSELALALESALPVGCGCNPRVDIQIRLRTGILLDLDCSGTMTQRDQTFINLLIDNGLNASLCPS